MVAWRFLDYVREDGVNLIGEWLSRQDARVRAQFDATLLLLRATEDWTASHVQEFKVLTGTHLGLGEIRFHIVIQRKGAKTTHRRRFRPVGPWPPKGSDFVILLGCEKSGRIYNPPYAFDAALVYAKELADGKGSTRERA
jgi:hypothetical protein